METKHTPVPGDVYRTRRTVIVVTRVSGPAVDYVNLSNHSPSFATPALVATWYFVGNIMALEALISALRRAVNHAEHSDDYDWIGAAYEALDRATDGA